MLTRFIKHIRQEKLYDKNHKLLLAISGGPDSVALAHLLKKGNFNFELAHCNFKLRGEESDKDELFCIRLAKTLDVKIHSQEFNVKDYCKRHKVSLQMAARELRYNWFYKLLEERKLDYILTAHHANDNIETVLINLLRGTGIKGLAGIQEKNGNIVRPLLLFSREDIEKYIKDNKLNYRLDKSNLEDNYQRNFLRLHVIPALKKQNPSLEKTVGATSFILNEASQMLGDILKQKKKELVEINGNFILIDKNKLKSEKYISSVLHYILEEFNFNPSQVEDIRNNILTNGLAGKNFKSATHLLTIDRQEIVIKEIEAESFKNKAINSINDLKKYFEVEEIKSFKMPAQNQLLINPAQLFFPLKIRTKKIGDKFKPFGMKGFKLLSDFYKENKLNQFEKESCNLLVNGNNEIIWVMGYRSDERYRVNKHAKNLLLISKLD